MSTIDTSGNVHHDAGSPGGGQFTGKVNTAPGALLADERDLTAETPVAIDTELADLYSQAFVADMRAQTHPAYAEDHRKHASQERSDYHRERHEANAARQDNLAAEQEAIAAQVRLEMLPLEAEFVRRGRWTRAFLATSANGHVHSSLHCSTCNKMGKLTRFAMMTDYYGAIEEEVIEDAGERVCPTCYPEAPVSALSRPTKMFSEEKEAAKARAEREAEKARKAAERDVKAISSPDGSELREPRKYGQHIKTLVTAERELVDVISTYEFADQRTRHLPNRDMVADRLEWRGMLIEAIAAKKGITPEQVREEAAVKAEKRYKLEWGA